MSAAERNIPDITARAHGRSNGGVKSDWKLHHRAGDNEIDAAVFSRINSVQHSRAPANSSEIVAARRDGYATYRGNHETSERREARIRGGAQAHPLRKSRRRTGQRLIPRRRGVRSAR
ncbi:hypothetical protein MRX96_039234 [Rhipicephalus microplus]